MGSSTRSRSCSRELQAREYGAGFRMHQGSLDAQNAGNPQPQYDAAGNPVRQQAGDFLQYDAAGNVVETA